MNNMESILFNKNFEMKESVLILSIIELEQKGFCPTWKRISNLMGVSRATALRTATKLESRGILSLINETNKIQGTLPTKFKINTEVLEKLTTEENIKDYL